MSISKLKSNSLRGLIPLINRRDALLRKIESLEETISRHFQGATNGLSVKSKGMVKFKRGKRGALKARILAALKRAGSKGIGVKEISTKLGVKNQNVHVWFSSTGKKVPGLQKIAEGRYRLKS